MNKAVCDLCYCVIVCVFSFVLCGVHYCVLVLSLFSGFCVFSLICVLPVLCEFCMRSVWLTYFVVHFVCCSCVFSFECYV